MKREEIATRLMAMNPPLPAAGERLTLEAAAAELRKRCATCQHFRAVDAVGCCDGLGLVSGFGEGPIDVPSDGSGFCHNWTSKADTKAGQL